MIDKKILDFTQLADHKILSFKLPPINSYLSDDQAMELALDSALLGVGETSPNPLVGAVLLDKNNLFLGADFHAKYGSGHAEFKLLDKFGLNPQQNLKLFVSLEPCSHYGKQPPCTEIIIQKGVKEVYFAVKDTNPKVSGNGQQALQSKGIKCEQLKKFEERGKELIRSFLYAADHAKCFVALKVATDTNNKLANKGASRQWISSSRARSYTHFLRAYYDAVMVGANTFYLDNPRLDIRDFGYAKRIPWRIVVGPQFEKCDLNHHFFDNSQHKVVFIVDDKNFEDFKQFSHLKLILLESKNSFFNPQEILNELFKIGIQSVLIEGGSILNTYFLNSGLVNYLHHFVANDVSLVGETISWHNAAKKFSLINSKEYSYNNESLFEGFVEYI